MKVQMEISNEFYKTTKTNRSFIDKNVRMGWTWKNNIRKIKVQIMLTFMKNISKDFGGREGNKSERKEFSYTWH